MRLRSAAVVSRVIPESFDSASSKLPASISCSTRSSVAATGDVPFSAWDSKPPLTKKKAIKTAPSSKVTISQLGIPRWDPRARAANDRAAGGSAPAGRRARPHTGALTRPGTGENRLGRLAFRHPKARTPDTQDLARLKLALAIDRHLVELRGQHSGARAQAHAIARNLQLEMHVGDVRRRQPKLGLGAGSHGQPALAEFEGPALAALFQKQMGHWGLAFGLDVRGKIARSHALGSECGHASDLVLQLSHVARPRIRLQELQGLLFDGNGLRTDALARQCSAKVPHEEAHVALALAQGRKVESHHVQAVEEVFAEVSLGDHFRQVAVRRRDDAHVYLTGLVRPHGAHFAALENPQQLGLHLERHVADLVQEERAAIGRHEMTIAVRHRSRERALLVPEELALEQVGGHGGAVLGQEALRSTRGLFVQGARHELLARARFAVDEDGHVGRRDARDQVEQREHRRARTDQTETTGHGLLVRLASSRNGRSGGLPSEVPEGLVEQALELGQSTCSSRLVQELLQALREIAHRPCTRRLA